MSSQSKHVALVLAVVVLAMLTVPLIVSAGTVAGGPAPIAERPASAPTGLFQVRCWQYGRLLFEERDVALPADIASGLKLRGTDRRQQPVYVADTGNATCLIRGGSTPRR